MVFCTLIGAVPGLSRCAYSLRQFLVLGEPGSQRLKQDLDTGEWERRYADLPALDAYDAGYRLVVAG